MTITPGQSLTPEQVRNLPDGAVVRMHKSDRPYLELTVKNGELDIPNCSYNDTQPKGWFALPLATYRWESCLLVSLPPAPSEPGSRIEPQAEPAKPELPVWVITCDRCGTTYKNNERHACVAREPSEPSPGDALTYEQAMALPDCAVVSAIWGDDGLRTYCTVGSNNSLGVPKKFGGASLEHEDYWNYDQWHSVRLESLPEPSEPSPGEGYRWLNIGERIIDTDEYLTSYGGWMQTGGLEFKCTVAKKYRRRIEPQAEPAKPERQASEIEKRAALALVYTYLQDVKSAVSDDKNPYNECSKFVEAYDYAKSIGAIE